MICPGYDAPQFFLYTSQIPPLIYYSHLSVLITLFIGIFVYRKNRTLPSKILLFLSLAFLGWTFFDLITWTNNSSNIIMFAWSLLPLMYALIIAACVYFVYAFIDKQDITLKIKAILFGILFPALIITPTSLNLKGFNLDLCGSAGFEGNIGIYYKLILGIGSFLWILFFTINRYGKAKQEDKKQIAFFAAGVEIFLLCLFISEFIASYLADAGILDDFSVTQYGFFAMTIFMGILAYLIVKYKAFNIKLLAAQALVFTIIGLTASQLFFIKVQINFILTGITLALTVLFGGLLIRSVNKEVEQREKIQRLAASLADTNKELAVANAKLKELDKQKTEFVSLASHQLRSPLTAIKGYSSMILEGSFGKINAKAKEAIGRVFESSQKLVLVIEDFLNVTRIELGRMKYDLTEFSLNTLVNNVIGEQKPNVERRGLGISYEEDGSEYKVYADMGKLSQVISNLIDNSVKYTKQGSIKVRIGKVKAEDGKEKVRLSISDTGVGIEPQVMPHLFEKFVRAYDASKTNIIGTGLGLFVAKQIIDAHSGRIWAESEGKGKGSTFNVEMNLSTGVAPIIVEKPSEFETKTTPDPSPAPAETPIPQPDTRHFDELPEKV